MMSDLTGFKETEIGPILADWEAMLLAQTEEERAKADAQFQVLSALGFEEWRRG